VSVSETDESRQRPTSTTTEHSTTTDALLPQNSFSQSCTSTVESSLTQIIGYFSDSGGYFSSRCKTLAIIIAICFSLSVIEEISVCCILCILSSKS